MQILGTLFLLSLAINSSSAHSSGEDPEVLVLASSSNINMNDRLGVKAKELFFRLYPLLSKTPESKKKAENYIKTLRENALWNKNSVSPWTHCSVDIRSTEIQEEFKLWYLARALMEEVLVQSQQVDKTKLAKLRSLIDQATRNYAQELGWVDEVQKLHCLHNKARLETH